MIHPGADDNASGVATMLAVAKQLSILNSQGKLKGNKNILIAAWSGEELGVLGSSYFVDHLGDERVHEIDAAINLDMVGHLRDKLILQGIGSSHDWPQCLQHIPIASDMQVVMQSDPYLPTDSTPFYLHQIPTINFFSGAHDAYHTPRDTAETLNYQGMETISLFLVQLILALENHSKPMVFHAVEKKYQTHQQRFKVYLGTIPDYGSDEISGIKLSGVVKGSPAARAGLDANDIIIQLAGKNIQNIYDYMHILNSLKAGEQVTMLILRHQHTMTLHVTAKAR